jgi:hypothetical protein
MEMFHSGKATTLVATDIAARGIHVDDVALVVHADPPMEHKAYLHRSGRTARAGAAGTVITLMTDDQVRDVRQLTRAAGIKPTTTRIDNASHPMLATLAPGARTVVVGGIELDRPEGTSRPSGGGGGGRRSGGGGRSGGQPSGGGRNRRGGSGSGKGAPKAASKPSGGRSGGGRSRGSSSTSSSGGGHSAASFSGRR